MRRLLPLLGLTFALAGVGAAPALAETPVRPNAAVTAAGVLQTAAKDYLADPNNWDVPHWQMSTQWLTDPISIEAPAGTYTTLPAGTHLSKEQLATLQSQHGIGYVSGRVTETRPTNAIITTEQARVDSGVGKVRRRGGFLPSMRERYGGASANTRLALKAGLWSVAATIAPVVGAAVYEALTGSTLGNTTPEAAPGGLTYNCFQTYCSTKVYGWKHYEQGDAIQGITNNGDGTGFGTDPLAPEDGWYSQVYFHSSNVTPTIGSSVTVESARQISTSVVDYPNDHHEGVTWENLTPGATWMTLPVSGSGTSQYWLRYLSEGQMENKVDSRPITEGDYNDYSSGDQYEYNDWDFSTNVNNTAAGATLGAPGSQTDEQSDTEISIAVGVSPGVDPTVGTGTGTGTSPDNPTHITPPATTVPAAPALDFTPISDIDFGCKFPYGIFCYALAFTDLFDVTPDAPCFCFELDGFDTPVGTMSLGSYNVDLEVMDDWMSTWRSILSVVLWVGAIYFVATRLLGFKAGGDPGAAMDDVL